jgi:hypothetical protein
MGSVIVQALGSHHAGCSMGGFVTVRNLFLMAHPLVDALVRQV